MFGWLTYWGAAARQRRAEQEVEDAIGRSVLMARAIEARRAAEQRSREVADLVAHERDITWAHARERERERDRAADAARQTPGRGGD